MKCDGYICRINPGQYEGVTQSKVDKLLNDLVKAGVKGMSSAEAMQKMGAKDALVKIKNLQCGLSCTAAYYDMKELEAGFSKTMAKGDIRVLKQNRGSQGEGIWVCKVAEGEEKKIKDGVCPPDIMLDLQEAFDNHKEKKSISEFMKFCQKYLDGENGQLVDQKFLPRIVEGEVRVFMIGENPIELIHKKPVEGGISATLASGAKYVKYSPDDPQFAPLMNKFKADIPNLMQTLDLEGQPLPLIWTTDFIYGPKDQDGNDTFFVGEFNCSCVGIKKQLDRALDVAQAAIKTCGGSTVRLLPQPKNPTGKLVLLECKGGKDKGKDGHRSDSIPICNALIEKNWRCTPLYYTDADFDKIKNEILQSAGYICRINPGQYEGVTQAKLDGLLNDMVKAGKKGMSSAEAMQKMGAKDALVKIKDLQCGLSCTAAYYDMKELETGFSKTMATGDTRVLKQNRGSQGEGIWVCKLAEGEEKKIENGVCPPDTMLELQEAFDNHKEKKSISEFMKFCQKYLDGENGQLVDQKFLPRIVEGEVRVFMIGDKPIELIHKKPVAGGISATLASGAKYVKYSPDEAKFALLMSKFKADIPNLMKALDLEGQPLPLIWTADFILGPKAADGQDTYYIGEFNCSCVGIKKQLDRADDVADAAIKTCMEGKVAGGDSKSGAVATLLPQPENPKGKIVLLECRGGNDKGTDGHRSDSIPICNALIQRDWACVPMFYSDADYEKVRAAIMSSAGYICRINPGSYDGVTQANLEQLLNDMVKAGKKGMSSAEAMKKMGAKDALVKIKDLECGLSDTAAYYDTKDLENGLPRTMAKGETRVIKQNRGSQGEGIWVVKVKEGEQKKIQNGVCPPDIMLDLQEAYDNHKEEQTLGDFMQFCRKYLEGEDGQLVDQKFLPRIVEGEVRVFMIGDKPIELIHKKPVEGGISATLSSGAKYVTYTPDDAKFAPMMKKFKSDLPKLMKTLELEGQPLPLVWTTDFILGEKTADGEDTFYVGEFNCSCVGIKKQLDRAHDVAEAAIQVCTS